LKRIRGGGLAIKREEPPAEELRYAAVIKRLDLPDGKLTRLVQSKR